MWGMGRVYLGGWGVGQGHHNTMISATEAPHLGYIHVHHLWLACAVYIYIYTPKQGHHKQDKKTWRSSLGQYATACGLVV